MRHLIATICILGVVGIVIGSATNAGDTVTATVTIGTVSVSVDPTSFDYGTTPYSGTRESFDVIDNEGDYNIEATVGTVETDLDIKGADTTGWTLDDTDPYEVGDNIYVHKFGLAADNITRPASYTALTKSFADNVLAADVTASSSVWFGLQILVPSSGETAQQSAAVTLQATWSE